MPIAYPYGMSDWYGYDQDCSFVRAFFTSQTDPGACNITSSNRTYYHDGSDTYPDVGDIVYSDAAGTTKVSGGKRRIFLPNGNGSGTYTVDSAASGQPNSGVVNAVALCA